MIHGALYKGPYFLALFKRFYLFMRDIERQRYRQREKQTPHEEPDVGLDPRTLGSCWAKGRHSTTGPTWHPFKQVFKWSLGYVEDDAHARLSRAQNKHGSWQWQNAEMWPSQSPAPWGAETCSSKGKREEVGMAGNRSMMVLPRITALGITALGIIALGRYLQLGSRSPQGQYTPLPSKDKRKKPSHGQRRANSAPLPQGKAFHQTSRNMLKEKPSKNIYYFKILFSIIIVKSL